MEIRIPITIYPGGKEVHLYIVLVYDRHDNGFIVDSLRDTTDQDVPDTLYEQYFPDGLHDLVRVAMAELNKVGIKNGILSVIYDDIEME